MKKIKIDNAQHPTRQKAIKVLELMQEYLCPKCVKNTDGENWFELEDKIVNIIK